MTGTSAGRAHGGRGGDHDGSDEHARGAHGGRGRDGGSVGAVKTFTGTVTDAGTAGLAYKTITLTGSPGVYFGTAASGAGLVNTMQLTSNGASGGIGTYTAYAVFTKTGTATITATSEGKSVTVTRYVAPAVAGNEQNVTVNNVAALPNQTVIVTGKVTDAFGNPVKSCHADRLAWTTSR